jgi:hypothetical protein
MEIAQFLKRLSPTGVTPTEDLCFGDRMSAEHCMFAAQLLDPTETELQQKLAMQGLNAKNVANSCYDQTYQTLLALSQNSGKEIEQAFSGIDLAKTKSIISPALAAHVVREGQWFLSRMAQLTWTPAGSRPAWTPPT